MIITCNECGTSFNVDETLLDAAGNKFRCSVCKEIFFYYPPISGEESTEPLANTNNAGNPNEHSEVVDNSADSDGGSSGNNSKNMSPTTDHDLDFNPEDIGVELNFETGHEELAEDVDLNLGIELDGVEDKADAAELHGETEDADLFGLEGLLVLDEDGSRFDEKEDVKDIDLSLNQELFDDKENGDEDSSPEMEHAADEKNIENGIRTPPTGFELDFDMGDEVTEQPEADISLEINFSDYEDKKEVIKETVDDVVQQPETVKPVEIKPEPKVSRKKDYLKKGKAGKGFAILVVLFIITCGSFVGVMLLDTKGTKIMYVTDFVRSVSNILVTQDIYIPYVTDLAKSNNQQDLDGRNKITVLEEPLKGEYIENVKAGLLYVITGQIQNNYDHPRSFVKVTANLIAKTGTQTESAYCGNILSGIDLENLDLNKIIDHLNNKEGDNKNNINIKAGNNFQFMVVFANLLEDIEMFNVHIESSSP